MVCLTIGTRNTNGCEFPKYLITNVKVFHWLFSLSSLLVSVR